MKNLYFIILILLGISSTIKAQDPLVCNNNLNLSLDVNGEAYITPDMALSGAFPSGYDSIWVEPSYVNCDSDNAIFYVYGSYNNGMINSCSGTLQIFDLFAPVAIIENDFEISFNGSSIINLTPELLDNFSYDNCGIDSFLIVPNFLDCNSPSPSLVSMTVFDKAGNTAQAHVSITIASPTSGSSLVCNSLDIVDISNGNVQLGMSDFVASGVSSCYGDYSYVINATNGGPNIISGLVKSEHLGYTYEVIVTDNNTAETCTLEFAVSDGPTDYTVCVKTGNDEAVSGVEIAPGIITDETGCVTYNALPGATFSPYKGGEQLEAVDMIDVDLLREAILSASLLEPVQLISGNIINLDVVSTYDQALIEQALLGEYTFDPNWKFVESSYPLDSKGNAVNLPSEIKLGFTRNIEILGMKMGDVDLSYNQVVGQDLIYSMTVKDQVMVNGESLSIPLNFSSNGEMTSLQMTIPFETDDFVIEDITSELEGFSFDLEKQVKNNLAQIFWISSDEETSHSFVKGDVLLEVKLKAKSNTTLNLAFDLSDDGANKMRETDVLTGTLLKVTYEDLITTGINDFSLHEFTVYPNPSSGSINIELENDDFNPSHILIYALDGRKVMEARYSSNLETILQRGVYILNLLDENQNISREMIIIE